MGVAKPLESNHWFMHCQCACGLKYVQRVSQLIGVVLTFPFEVEWNVGTAEPIRAKLAYCPTCGETWRAHKPEQIPEQLWEQLYEQPLQARFEAARGIKAEMDKEANWPVYGESAKQEWYEAWKEHPSTHHMVVDKDGNIVDVFKYPTMPLDVSELPELLEEQPIKLVVEADQFEWKVG